MSFLYFLPLILAYFSIYKKGLLFLSLVIMSLIAGLRYNVLGYDYGVYKFYFDEVSEHGNFYGYELGYYYLNLAFNYIGFSFFHLILFVSILLHFSLYKALSSLGGIFRVNPAVILFFFIASGAYHWIAYTITRQSISTIFIYILIPLMVLSHKNLKVGMATAFGSLFHVSSIIYPLMANLRNNIAFLIMILLPLLLIAIVSIFLPSKYMGYIAGEAVGKGYFFEAVAIVLFSIFIALRRPCFVYFVLFKIAFIFLLFSYFSAFHGVNLSRFLTPFTIFFYIPIIIFIQTYFRSFRNYIYFILLPVFALRLHLFILGFGVDGYPYKSIFFN